MRTTEPKQLSSQERQAIRQLAEDLPTLWNAETTTQVQRKEIVRQVIQKITVTVKGESEQVQVIIEWSGGSVCQAQIIRPVAKWTQVSYYPQLCKRLEQLAQTKLTTDEIIDHLHQEGFHPPKRRPTFNRQIVRTLMRHLGLETRQFSKTREGLAENEWWLPDLAIALEMPTPTLYSWVKRGWVKASQLPEPPKHWIIWADEAELERLRIHRQRPAGEILHQLWRGEVPTITIPPKGPQTDSP